MMVKVCVAVETAAQRRGGGSSVSGKVKDVAAGGLLRLNTCAGDVMCSQR